MDVEGRKLKMINRKEVVSYETGSLLADRHPWVVGDPDQGIPMLR
jgi:hypothetical protein